jgi:AcrR family transcriptional regulator
MAEPTRSRNRRGEGEKLRESIIAATGSLIDTSDDPRTLTLRGIARHAGISAPSIYPHFDDLQTILDAVLERSFAELDAVVASAMDRGEAPDGRLMAGCRAYVGYGWAHPLRYRFMVGASGFAPQAITTFLRVEDALRECVETGLSDSQDAHEDTFLLWVGMHGMATLEKPERAQLRRLGALDRPALTDKLARKLAGLGHADP